MSKILEQHDITCTDVANIIKSIHSTKVRSDDAEEEKSAEAPSEGGGETQEDDAPAENSDTPGSEPGAEAVVETDETSTPGAHIETPAEEGGDEEEEEGGEQEEEGAKTHAHETQAEQGPAVSEEEEGDSAAAVKHAPSAADGEHVAQEEEREAPAVREERVEEEVEKGIMDNVAEEEGEEGEELAGPTPQERIARARRLIADGGSGGSDPLAERADYLEHRAYWSHARCVFVWKSQCVRASRDRVISVCLCVPWFDGRRSCACAHANFRLSWSAVLCLACSASALVDFLFLPVCAGHVLAYLSTSSPHHPFSLYVCGSFCRS